jgi:hypothetical protein
MHRRIKAQSFPIKLIAGIFNFPPEAGEFFEVDPVQREVVRVVL